MQGARENKVISWLKSENFARICILALLGFMTFLIMMYSKQSPWRKAESWTDSSVFKYVALEMSRGGVPYVDTFDHKGPLLYIINLVGQMLGYMRGIWLVEFVFMFGTLATMYKTARLFCGRTGAWVAALISSKWIFDYFQYGNFTEEYAMLPICIATYIFLDYMLNNKVNKLRLMICGFCFAAVFLLRANMIAVWMVYCVAIFVKCLAEKAWKMLWEFVLYFLIGMSILMIPIALWLGLNGAFDDFVQSYFVFNLTYSTEAGGRALASAKWKAFVHFFNQEIVLYAVVVLLYLWVKGKNRLADGCYIAYVFLMFILLCMSGMQYGHYGLTIVPALVYPVARFIGMVEEQYKKNANPLVLAAVMYVLVPLVLPTWVDACNNAVQVYENQENSNYTKAVRNAAKIIKEHTTEEETISVYGNWDIVYLISERLSASKYSYQFPIGTIDSAIMEEYFENLTEEQPKVIVIQENRMDDRMRSFLDTYHYTLTYNEMADNSGSQVYVK